MKKHQYHSALKPDLSGIQPVDRFTLGQSVAFQYDICTTQALPVEYNMCDLLFVEPSWAQGYELFQNRARTSGSTYSDYRIAMSRIIELSAVPTLIVAGKSDSKKLPTPTQSLSITIHGYQCSLLAYGIQPSIIPNTESLDIVRLLAKRFFCVGDFSCGYGNVGRIFRENGKHFVMSDINPWCIGYIAKQCAHWTRQSEEHL